MDQGDRRGIEKLGGRAGAAERRPVDAPLPLLGKGGAAHWRLDHASDDLDAVDGDDLVAREKAQRTVRRGARRKGAGGSG